MCRFSIWGAAMAAGEATRYVLPNVHDFDDAHDLGPATAKPHGHGSASQASSIPAAPPTSTSSDPSAIFMAAMLPLILSLTQSISPHPLVPVPAPSPLVMPMSRDALLTIEGPPFEPGITTDFPFLPTHTLECVLAFKEDVGINIVHKVDALDHHDLTPNIIHEVPHEHLAGIPGLSEGKAIKFQLFCHQWTKEFSQKLKQKEVV
ncbi:hypothetical protein FRC11_010433 [Ceratobasidium sp. 423]|nr:hypothetical protein FRC11_010433 [Ceratobasidium sp. 423]